MSMGLWFTVLHVMGKTKYEKILAGKTVCPEIGNCMTTTDWNFFRKRHFSRFRLQSCCTFNRYSVHHPPIADDQSREKLEQYWRLLKQWEEILPYSCQLRLASHIAYILISYFVVTIADSAAYEFLSRDRDWLYLELTWISIPSHNLRRHYIEEMMNNHHHRWNVIIIFYKAPI